VKTLEKITAKVAREKELAVSQAHYLIDALSTIANDNKYDLLEDVFRTALTELEIISRRDSGYLTVKYVRDSKLEIYLDLPDSVEPLCELYWDGTEVTIARLYISPRVLAKIIIDYQDWRRVGLDLDRYKPWKEEED